MNIDITKHQGLVHLVAKRFHWACGPGMEYEDLIQVGNMALVFAAETFEPERGFKFSTYATYWVKHYIKREVENASSTVRLPTWYRRKMWKEGKQVHNLGMSLDTSKHVDTDFSNRADFILNENAEPSTLPTDDYNPTDVKAMYKRALETMRAVLTEQEFKVVQRRYMHDHTLQAIADDMNVSREWVRILCDRAMEVVRTEMRKQYDA